MSAAKKELRPAVRAWVDALLSGEFEQATGYLNATAESATGKGMCCLGVAAELCRREHPDRLQSEPAEGSGAYVLVDTVTGDTSSQELIPFVMDWLGVGERNPHVYVPMGASLALHDLASLNDDGSSFRVIADLIERDADLGDGTNDPDPDEPSEVDD